MSATVTSLLPVITSLRSDFSHLTAAVATETVKTRFIAESRSLEYVIASLSQAQAEVAMATATAPSAVAAASAAASSASSVISTLSFGDNIYGMTPSYGGNIAMAVVMAVFFAIHSGLGLFYQSWWFGISYFCGCGLEMAGYIGRSLSSLDTSAINPFLLQIICLTIAPCFIMGGIYYLLAQLVMIYGPQFALLKPMWYSYIFIACDFISLVIQGSGGGIAGSNLTNYKSPESGTHVMVAGLAFQVVSMSVFLVLFFHFFWKVRYLRRNQSEIDHQFNPQYKDLREHKLFKIFPLVILTCVTLVYVRSIYRVIELAEGWSGFLITHEVYFMILDAMMMALTCLIFIPFHPGHLMGKGSIPVQGTRAYKKMLISQGLEEQADIEKTIELERSDASDYPKDTRDAL